MIDYTLDVRIVELCREAEDRRRYNKLRRTLRQVNWYAVLILVGLAVVDGVLLFEMIRHF